MFHLRFIFQSIFSKNDYLIPNLNDDHLNRARAKYEDGFYSVANTESNDKAKAEDNTEDETTTKTEAEAEDITKDKTISKTEANAKAEDNTKAKAITKTEAEANAKVAAKDKTEAESEDDVGIIHSRKSNCVL